MTYTDLASSAQPVPASDSAGRHNQEFWSELCGTLAWRKLGLQDIDADSLSAFDRWYFEFYPYLERHIPFAELGGRKVLEIGLGFGTIGQRIMQTGADYTGVDIADTPVEMLQQRAADCGRSASARARIGDARALEFGAAEFDYVVSIGCLHHTGDIRACLTELHRVVKPGGQVIVMLYSKESYRHRFFVPLLYLSETLKRRLRGAEPIGYKRFLDSRYDSSSAGEVAPIIEYFTRADIERLFARFADLSIHAENVDDYDRIRPVRPLLLRTVGRKWGLDYYVRATR